MATATAGPNASHTLHWQQWVTCFTGTIGSGNSASFVILRKEQTELSDINQVCTSRASHDAKVAFTKQGGQP